MGLSHLGHYSPALTSPGSVRTPGTAPHWTDSNQPTPILLTLSYQSNRQDTCLTFPFSPCLLVLSLCSPWHGVSPPLGNCQFSCSVVSDSMWPHGLQHTRPPCPSTTLGVYSFMFIESVMPSNHLILCRPLFLLTSIFPSIRVFTNESVLCIRWPKDWSFSFSINPSNEYWGLDFF